MEDIKACARLCVDLYGMVVCAVKTLFVQWALWYVTVSFSWPIVSQESWIEISVLHFMRQVVHMRQACLGDVTANSSQSTVYYTQSIVYMLSNDMCFDYMKMWLGKLRRCHWSKNKDALCPENIYMSIIVLHVLHSHRWWYRQPADRSPWGAVEDAGSASTAAVNTLPLFPASHHAATLPQSSPLTLLCPHGWVASHPSIPHTVHLNPEKFVSILYIVCKACVWHWGLSYCLPYQNINATCTVSAF